MGFIQFVFAESEEDFLKIFEMVFFSFAFDGEVINVTFNSLVLHILEYLHHSPLICSANIFQTKWHDSVAIHAKWGPK